MLEGWPATPGSRAKGTCSKGKLALMFSVIVLQQHVPSDSLELAR